MYSQELGTPNQRTKELLTQGDTLYSQRTSLLSVWQEIADNMYPERADFTQIRNAGYRQFANLLTTSYPVTARRDLASLFSSMLRPMGQQWFMMKTTKPEEEDDAARLWLERSSMIMKRAMYDPEAQFVKATKAGDNDFVAFGQCVLTIELDYKTNTLLYKCRHLRDIVWTEDSRGQVGMVQDFWKPSASTLRSIYGDKIHSKVKEALAKDPTCEVQCRYMVIPADDYDLSTQSHDGTRRYVHICVDTDNQWVMDFQVTYYKKYIVPRWETVSLILWGSQYALSPCVVAALPDARLLQSMTLTILEAGEKTTNPPLIAVEEAIRSDISVYAGGITYVDADYDEKLGEVLRPISQNNNIPIGIEMIDRTKAAISSAFYLDKLNLPAMDRGDKMTAFEVQQRVSEYIRNAMPLFEPVEQEYNAAVCEETFTILSHHGAFGPADEMPESLSGKNIGWQFISPLIEAEDEKKAQQYLNAKGIVAASIDLDPTAAALLNVQVALRDTLRSSVPAAWVQSEEYMAGVNQKAAQQQEAASLIQNMDAGAEAATKIGEAGQVLGGAAPVAGV